MSALTSALVARVASGDLVVDEEISSPHLVVLTDGSGEQVAFVDRVKLAEALAEVDPINVPTSWAVRLTDRSVPLDRVYMRRDGWGDLDGALRFLSRAEATRAADVAGDAVTFVPLYGSEVL